MKRFMFALGLLATVAISESDAGYIVIRIVLEGGIDATSGPSNGPPSAGPGPMSFGPKTGGIGSGPRPGVGGPPPGSGSVGGPPPGIGSSGSPGPTGVTGPMGTGPGATASGQLFHDPARSVYVVVPYTNDITKQASFYKKAPLHSHNPHWQPAIKHPFGYANLLFDNSQIQLYLDLGPLAPKGLKTRQTELGDKHNKWLKTPADTQLLLDLATDSLEQGQVAAAAKYADELVVAGQDGKARTTPQVDRFLKAYAQIKDAIAKPARLPSEGRDWKDRIGFSYGGTSIKDYASPHYHLIYWEGMDSEAMRRVAQLEDNFKAFFLANAVRGVVVPVPERPLIAVLARSTDDVRKLSISLDGLSQVSDGFYSPDHGIVVLSPERLDAVGQTFKRQLQDMFRQGVSRKMLLEGNGPKIDDTGMNKDSKTAEEVARMMTWTVVERYAEEESEWSAVSREGSRQLLHATGVLPQHVALPSWLAEGSASFYQRPKGPVFTKKDDDKDIVTVALTTGYGLPNYARQKQFQELVRLHQFDPGSKQKADPGQVLRNIVSDSYFTAVQGGFDVDDSRLPLPQVKKAPPAGVGPPPPPRAAEDSLALKRKRTEFLATKAQSTSWALYYYLAKTNPVGLDRYLAELGKLPRDFPLDEPMRLATFARSFNLTLEAKRTDDRATFADFGASWLQWMETVPVVGIDLPLADLATTSAPGTGPGTGPGALPGGGPLPGIGKPGGGS